jgi:ribosomal protein S5
MQRHCKHASTTIELLLETVFSTRSVQRGVEAGSNTSTVTLRVVGGDEKGSLKSETAKYGRESQGTLTRERLRWQGPAAIANGRPVLS